MEDFNLRDIKDERNGKICLKIRDAEISKLTFMLILGEKEVKDGSISVRRQGAGDLGSTTPMTFDRMIEDEINEVMAK